MPNIAFMVPVIETPVAARNVARKAVREKPVVAFIVALRAVSENPVSSLSLERIDGVPSEPLFSPLVLEEER